MPASATQTVESIGDGTRRRLAGFARTLRDNGFKVGLTETRDALAVLGIPGRQHGDPRSSRPCARCLPEPAPIGSGSTRFSRPIGAATACAGCRR